MVTGTRAGVPRPWLSHGTARGRAVAVAVVLGCLGCSDDLRRWNASRPVLLETTPDGAIVTNQFGVQGHWFAYGDRYDEPATCINAGQHAASRCSEIILPNPEAPAPHPHFRPFEPDDTGAMCIVAMLGVLDPCCTSDKDPRCTGKFLLCNEENGVDYNMWGAGIGLDFNARAENQQREPWDPKQVRGVSFDITTENLEPSDIRVEFPFRLTEPTQLPQGMGSVLRNSKTLQPGEIVPAGSTTEEYAHGSPFWTKRPAGEWVSPVSFGHNEVSWDDVKKPAGVLYDELDTTQLIGIQFHVVTNDKPRKFRFCVKNFSFLL